MCKGETREGERERKNEGESSRKKRRMSEGAKLIQKNYFGSTNKPYQTCSCVSVYLHLVYFVFESIVQSEGLTGRLFRTHFVQEKRKKNKGWIKVHRVILHLNLRLNYFYGFYWLSIFLSRTHNLFLSLQPSRT